MGWRKSLLSAALFAVPFAAVSLLRSQEPAPLRATGVFIVVTAVAFALQRSFELARTIASRRSASDSDVSVTATAGAPRPLRAFLAIASCAIAFITVASVVASLGPAATPVWPWTLLSMLVLYGFGILPLGAGIVGGLIGLIAGALSAAGREPAARRGATAIAAMTGFSIGFCIGVLPVIQQIAEYGYGT